MTNSVLAADLGGTNLRLAAVSTSGESLHSVRRKTPKGVAPDELVALVSEMADECGNALSGEKFTALGLGLPANVTADGVLRHFPNIPTLEGGDLRTKLSDSLGLTVVLENDATAAAIGEAWLGVSKGIRNSILVTLGTGVGGGIISEGEPLRGPDGGAGKIGHICVEPDGHPCGCGSNGCIEQYASATALARMAREAGLQYRNAYELFKAFEKGDEGAKTVFQRMGRYLGITLAGLVNTFNPDMIIIGGGVASGWDAFIEPLSKEIKYRAFSEPAERAKVVRSQLGDMAGILGAARSALKAVAQA